MIVYVVSLFQHGQSQGSYVLDQVALREFLSEVQDLEIGDHLTLTKEVMVEEKYNSLKEFGGW